MGRQLAHHMLYVITQMEVTFVSVRLDTAEMATTAVGFIFGYV